MDDSPRSAKRRKLETSTRSASNPLTKASATLKAPASGTLKRPGRRAVSLATANDQEPEKAAPPAVKVRASKSSLSSPTHTPDGALRKRRFPNSEEDIYNDFDGALEVDSPAKRLRNRIRGLVHNEGNSGDASPNRTRGSPGTNTRNQGQRARVHPGVNGTPKNTMSPRNLEGSARNHVGRSTLMNEMWGEEQVEAFPVDDEGELASGPATPSRRGRIQRTLNGTRSGVNKAAKGTSSGPITRRSTRSAMSDELDQDMPNQPNGANEYAASTTPAKRKVGRPRKVIGDKREDSLSKQSKGPQSTTATLAGRKRNTLDHDEKDDATSERGLEGPYNGKGSIKNTSSRRKRSYTDNIGSDDDETLAQSDDEVIESGLPGSVSERAPKHGQIYTSQTANDVDENSDVSDRMSVDEEERLGDAEINPFQVQRKKRQMPVATVRINAINGATSSDSELKLLKRIVLEKITVKRPAPLVGLDDEYKKVYQLVEHTVVAGEGNSMLLIGARGSGKTALVGKVLFELSKDHREDFHVVKLNGFVHTDDKLALREIWRQLGKEMEIEEDGLGKNYADTLSTLLALLSHPSEQTGQETEQVAKAVVFVMDEFDLFASHPRQTLLYNLFDIAQSRKAPIAVLGLTTKIDVAESLEKRVKSRFSHRYVHLSLAKSFTAFQEICKAVLLLQPDTLNVEEQAVLSQPGKLTVSNKFKNLAKDVDFLSSWNNSISVSHL